MRSLTELCVLAMLLANSMAITVNKQMAMEYVPGHETYIPQQEHAFTFGSPEQMMVALEENGIKLWDEGSNSTTIIIIVVIVILVIILILVCCCCCVCCAMAGAQAEAEKRREEENRARMSAEGGEAETIPMMMEA